MPANVIDLGSDSSAGFQVWCLPIHMHPDGLLKWLLKVAVGLRELPTWANHCRVWFLLLLPLGVWCRSFWEKKGEVIPSMALEKQVMRGFVGCCLFQVSGTAEIMVLKNSLRKKKKLLNHVLGYSISNLILSWLW